MKPCCEAPENRELVETRPDLVVQRCRVCGARHFTLSVDPVQLGVEGTAVGEEP